jgi:hypothetical protein
MIKTGRKKKTLSKLKKVEKSINKPKVKTEMTKRNLLSILITFFSKNCLNALKFNIT